MDIKLGNQLVHFDKIAKKSTRKNYIQIQWQWLKQTGKPNNFITSIGPSEIIFTSMSVKTWSAEN